MILAEDEEGPPSPKKLKRIILFENSFLAVSSKLMFLKNEKLGQCQPHLPTLMESSIFSKPFSKQLVDRLFSLHRKVYYWEFEEII